MHGFTAPGATAAAFLLLASAWHAPEARAETLVFEGRLALSLPGLEAMEVASGVGVAEVDGPQLERFEILAGTISGSTGIPVTDPTAAPVTSLRIAAAVPSGSLRIDPFAGPFSEPALTHNGLAMPGSLRICMLVAPLPPCLGGIGVPLTAGSPAEGVGHGGLLTVGLSGTLRMSLQGAPFTLGTASLALETQSGVLVTAFSSGSLGGPYLFTSTAGQPGGFFSLVTPTRVSASQQGEPDDLVSGFLRFEVRFLPEPGIALLLLAGAAALARLGRSRAASRESSPRDHEGR